REHGDFFEVRTEPENVDGVAGFLKEKGFNIESSKVSRVPKNYVKLDDRSAEQMLKLMDSLEDHDDVKNVFANFDIDDSVIEKFS
ncbi:MAG: YebC/PmpR family DNA-binding transcriptional regulator, partial [Deltaproteobacteria bacterium]|nr:YebC/PmpR family DNA-binding transcriptional regulator [Deltaproteobacteria bacterium]